MRALSSSAGLLLLCALPLGAADDPVGGRGLGEADDALRHSVEAALDPGADPCDDFYRFACGGWLDATPLPVGEARWGRGLSTRVEANRETLRGLVESALADPGPEGGARRALAAFQAACLDEATVESRGSSPLGPWLDRIDRIADLGNAFEVAAALHRLGATPFFALSPAADENDPQREAVRVGPGDLGLPDPGLYLATGAEAESLRSAYRGHVAAMLALAGAGRREARREARVIVDFERDLARIALLADRPSEPAVAPVDPPSGATSLPWRRFFAAAGREDLAGAARVAPSLAAALAQRLAAAPAETLRAYLRWTAVHTAAPLLSAPFVAEDFAFYGRRLRGEATPPPRAARCLSLTVRSLAGAIGPLYVETALPEPAREKAVETVAAVGEALAARVPGLPWIDAGTARRASARLRDLSYQIGRPDRWPDQALPAFDPGRLFENVAAARGAQFARRLERIGRPFDPAASLVSPFGVAAHWDPLARALVVPAGLLAPPFFGPGYPAAVNFGALGAVAGHELVHALDDLGAEAGDPGLSARYAQAAACLEAQVSGAEVAPGVRVDGGRTLRESVADVAGLAAAFDALRRSGALSRPEARAVPALSHEQLFFVAWAQSWCTLETPDYLRLQVSRDAHAPAPVRAVAAIRNSRDFRRAFRCEEGDPMVGAPPCTIW